MLALAARSPRKPERGSEMEPIVDNTYRIVHGAFGWHAVPADPNGEETRVFESRQAALAWCDQRLATVIADAGAPPSTAVRR